jgi:hypothetical protein
LHPDPEPLAEVVPLFNRHDADPSAGMYGTAPARSAHDVDAVPSPYGAPPSSPSAGPAASGELASRVIQATVGSYDSGLSSPYGSGLPTNPHAPGTYPAYAAAIPALPAWAATVLDESGFTVPEDVTPPAIWSQYQRAVDSIPDNELRASVLRAGWLALHDELGEA